MLTADESRRASDKPILRSAGTEDGWRSKGGFRLVNSSDLFHHRVDVGSDVGSVVRCAFPGEFGERW